MPTEKERQSKKRQGRYSTTRSRGSRRQDMKKDAEDAGYGRVISNINLRSIRLKNKSPGKSREMQSDVKYLKKQQKQSASRKSKKSKKSRK